MSAAIQLKCWQAEQDFPLPTNGLFSIYFMMHIDWFPWFQFSRLKWFHFRESHFSSWSSYPRLHYIRHHRFGLSISIIGVVLLNCIDYCIQILQQNYIACSRIKTFLNREQREMEMLDALACLLICSLSCVCWSSWHDVFWSPSICLHTL